MLLPPSLKVTLPLAGWGGASGRSEGRGKRDGRNCERWIRRRSQDKGRLDRIDDLGIAEAGALSVEVTVTAVLH